MVSLFVPFLWGAQPVLFPVYQCLTWASSAWGLFLPVMAAAVQCPRTLAVHFPSEIYRSTGASQVLPEFVKSLDLPNVRGIQLMPNGVVRVTYQEPAQCDAALTSGISFRGASLRIAPVDSRTRLVYVHDLPVEVPDDGLKVYLRAFGVVHSCSMQTYPAMPEVSTGTRVVKVTLAKDLPSSARVSGFDVRLWYQGQPQACPVCRSYGHRVKDCPFNGLCRRCCQPGHMADECSFRRSSSIPEDPVAGVDPSISEDEDDPDWVLSSASESGPCSGDEEVLRSVPTSVLAARAQKRSAPPAVPSDESSVDLRDNERSPGSDPVDPVSGTPESASAVVASDPVTVPDPFPVPVPDPVPSTSVSASAVVVPDGTPVSASTVSPESSVPPPAKESSGSKPRNKKPRSSQAAAASSSAKSTSVKSAPAKSSPAKSTSVPGPPFSTYWEASRRTGFGYVLQDCTGDPVYFDFDRFSRSIEIESTTFEYDRFVKYIHHNVERPYLWSCRTPHTKELPAGTPLEFPKSSK